MKSLGLTDHDLDWTVSDDLRSVTERVTARLRFFRGTWFLAVREGTPHIPDVLGRQADTALASRVLASAARTVPDVTDVTDVTVTVGPASLEELARDPRVARRAIARMTVHTEFGSTEVTVGDR